LRHYLNVPNFKNFQFFVNIKKHEYYSSKTLINLILINVIDNALKYYNEKAHVSKVEINISIHQKNIKIMIKDNGIGIQKDLLKDVFKIFFKGTQISKGIGLGLFTVKKCVTKLKGIIKLDSVPYSFTEIIILIPNKS
jgi:signal transduction histidine kinase